MRIKQPGVAIDVLKFVSNLIGDDRVQEVIYHDVREALRLLIVIMEGRRVVRTVDHRLEPTEVPACEQVKIDDHAMASRGRSNRRALRPLELRTPRTLSESHWA